MTPDEALAKLMRGNAAYVAGELEAPHRISERRAQVVAAQYPFAMILGCADSRVPCEHIFDQSLGDLFVCRVGGNILEPGALGSFEYALCSFDSLVVLVVLGHQRCGAVSAAISALKDGVSVPGEIGTIVAAIRPAVEATASDGLSETDYVEAVVRANAALVARSIVERSEIVRNAVTAQRLKVVAARYSLESGEVSLLV